MEGMHLLETSLQAHQSVGKWHSIPKCLCGAMCGAAGGRQVAVLVVGMNPGPFGMCQTGVPFGDARLVSEYLHVGGEVEQPWRVHPKRPIHGFKCKRREVRLEAGGWRLGLLTSVGALPLPGERAEAVGVGAVQVAQSQRLLSPFFCVQLLSARLHGSLQQVRNQGMKNPPSHFSQVSQVLQKSHAR